MKISFLVLSLFFIISVSRAQHCGTMEHFNQQLAEDPGLAARRQQIENHTAAYIAAHSNGNLPQAMTVITIPVVFHVVYSSAAQNISAIQCQAQIDQLNLDYARLNTDAGNTPSAFASLAANVGIQFCLAVRDPNGNSTTGIERRSTTTTSFTTNDNVKHYSSGGLDAWSSDSYLNIWTCNLGGSLLGYSQFPGGAPATDGCVILYSSVGSMLQPTTASPYNVGRTATHEVGHWLNLNHVWGDDGGSCSGTDNVADTPNQSDANYGCPSFPHTDACTGTAPGVMYMNYMDYTDDHCMNMFSQGQSARMNALFTAGGDRELILSSLGCQPITLPPCTSVTAGTITASNDTLCSGQTATLNLSGTTSGVSGISLLWQISSDGISGWNSAPGLNTGTTYTTSGNAGVNYFRCTATCASASLTDSTVALPIYAYGISSVANDTICTGGITNLIASGFGQINWYTDNTTSSILVSDDTLTANILGDTIFYASATGNSGNNYLDGPVNNSIGAGGNSNSLTRGLIFHAYTGLVLDSVSFYPGGAGNVLINLQDSASGSVINTATFPVVSSQVGQKVTVHLGFSITGGTSYNLIATGSTVASLYRNTAGAAFPYTVPNIISIRRSTNSTTSYYFFYNWKLHTGCSSARIAVPVHVGPLNVSITTSSDTICSGSSAILSTSGANTYTWMPGNLTGNTVEVHPNTSTPYTVTGFVSAGCADTSTLTITVVAPPSVSVSVSNDTICRGTSTHLTATGASVYTWYPGSATGSSLNVSPVNTTTYIATGSIGSCSSQGSTTVTVMAPTVTATVQGSNTICKGDTAVIQASGAISYVWVPGNMTGDTVSVAPLSTKTYTVTGTDAMGCTASQMITVFVNACLGVRELSPDESLGIYPNPAGDQVTIELSDLKNETYFLEVNDAIGRRVYYKELRSSGPKTSVAIDLNGLSGGIYFVHLSGNEKQFVRKLVKM